MGSVCQRLDYDALANEFPEDKREAYYFLTNNKSAVHIFDFVVYNMLEKYNLRDLYFVIYGSPNDKSECFEFKASRLYLRVCILKWADGNNIKHSDLKDPITIMIESKDLQHKFVFEEFEDHYKQIKYLYASMFNCSENPIVKGYLEASRQMIVQQEIMVRNPNSKSIVKSAEIKLVRREDLQPPKYEESTGKIV
jgi:hypothetical protein